MLISSWTFLYSCNGRHCINFFKVVLGRSLAEVAQNVIKYVRLSLLMPEELKQIEQENEKDRMIPVGTMKKGLGC